MPDSSQNSNLRVEFNRWAADGRGEGMESDHLPITLPVIAKMHIQPADSILDVGCGAGWLTRRLAALVPQGRAVGVDVSDEMISRARKTDADLENVMFVTSPVDELPWESDVFTHAISVESAYYWPEPAKGIAEMFRVLHTCGRAWILINYYRDNPHCHQWGPLLPIPTKLLSAEEWSAMFRDAGFSHVAYEFVPDPSPSPDTYAGRWFRDAAQLREFKRTGALLVHASKL